MQSLFIHLIALYQRWLSPLLGRRCRFYPSCSHYSSTAIERFGVFRGSLLGAARIMRCQPFCSGGFDAVPERFPRSFWRRNPAPHTPLTDLPPPPGTPSDSTRSPSP
ncbi:MAG: membrane protein insertion efficiency factor YidD [Lysobacterales bacterium]